MTADPTLGALLAEEVRRHLASLEEDAPLDAQRRALHALKGSSGLAGERALFEALARIERRHIDGDPSALSDARAVLVIAEEALSAGKPVPSPSWPEPPMDLRGKPVDPEHRARYAAEMADRLARVDEVFARERSETQAIGAIFREVHAMKAAALAAGDEATAWFVHGLEERARGAERDVDRARSALAEVQRWRGLLRELVAAPDRAVEVLRRIARGDHPSSAPPPPSRTEIAAEPEPRGALATGEESLRVPTASLDRLLDRVRSLEQAESTVASAGRELSTLVTRARRIRSALAASGARMRGAAAEMAALSDALEREAATLLGVAERARAEATSAHADIALMRTTTVQTLFTRVLAAATAHARRASRDVDVLVRGGETPIDRRVAEDLFDPILQLVQNAVVHGIEPPEERARRGKPLVGRVVISAEQRGASLVIVVSDDGAGIDVAAVESRAASRGGLSLARGVSNRKALLGLLFVPGFTTRDSADMLAGRGVGLGLVRESVRRLGGSVRLSNEPGAGLSAVIEVPIERGVVRVLWVRAGEATYALPARQVRRVFFAQAPASELALPLAACVRGLRAIVAGEALGAADAPSFVVELDAGREDDPSFFVTVDAIGDMEEVALHAPPPLVAAAGPYNGAIVRGDAVVLCLDVLALGELVHLVHGRRA